MRYIEPPAAARPTLSVLNCQMGSHTLHVEISGWADIACMQEHVAHLPDAVRRDRCSRGYWTTAPSYLEILDHLPTHFITRRSDSSHIAFLGDQNRTIIRIWNITHTHRHTHILSTRRRAYLELPTPTSAQHKSARVTGSWQPTWVYSASMHLSVLPSLCGSTKARRTVCILGALDPI